MIRYLRGLVLVGAIMLCIASCAVCLHYAHLCQYTASMVKAPEARAGLTTDQVIASLSTNVTVLGCIVAVVGIVAAVGALFGYSELRTATFRKTEENLVKIIRTLQDRGDLSQATAAVLLESVAPERVIVLGQHFADPKLGSVASNTVDLSASAQSDEIAKDYPGG